MSFFQCITFFITLWIFTYYIRYLEIRDGSIRIGNEAPILDLGLELGELDPRQVKLATHLGKQMTLQVAGQQIQRGAYLVDHTDAPIFEFFSFFTARV